MTEAPIPANATWTPKLGLVIVAPDVLLDSRRMRALHGRITQESMRDTLLWWWHKKLAGHFQASGRQKYHYAPRSEKYKLRKMRRTHGRTDLVFSGRTKAAMTMQRPKITFPKKGRAEGTLTGRATLARFPFPHRKSPPPGRVTPQQMASEITRLTADETQEAAGQFLGGYKKRLNEYLQTGPKRRSLKKALVN